MSRILYRARPQPIGPQSDYDVQLSRYLQRDSLDVELAFNDLTSQESDRGADFIGFRQAGAGAGGRSVQDKLRDTVSVKDFGAVGDGVANDTAAIQTALDTVFAAGGGTLYFPPGFYRVSSIVKEWTLPVSVKMQGAGKRATTILKITGTTTPVFDFSATAPSILETYSEIADMRILGASKGGHGLRLTNWARFVLRHIEIRDCDVALENLGSLIFSLYDCTLTANNFGYRSRFANTIYPNLVLFYGGDIIANSSWGLDIGQASGVHLYGVNLERNGTAGNTATGAMVVRNTVDDELGYSIITSTKTWFESNNGTNISIEAAAGTIASFVDCSFIASEAGRAMNVGAISNLSILDCIAPSVGDTITTAAASSVIQGGVIANITDTGTNRERLAVTTAGGQIKAATSRCGTATLVGGTVTVSYPALTGGDQVFALSQADGGSVGFLRCTSKSAGVGFTINSSSVTDTSTIAWFVVSAA